MKSLKLSLADVEVVSFATDDSVPTLSAEADSFGTFCRGCDSWDFSCGGTCAYTCDGGFCTYYTSPCIGCQNWTAQPLNA